MGQSGVMNLGAFMDRLGGRMDESRAALVDEAFDRLDTSGNGHLALDEARRQRYTIFFTVSCYSHFARLRPVPFTSGLGLVWR